MDRKKNPYIKQHNDEGRKKGLLRPICQSAVANLKSAVANSKSAVADL